MGSAIKQRTRPCCVNFGLWNDFVAFFLCRVPGSHGVCEPGIIYQGFPAVRDSAERLKSLIMASSWGLEFSTMIAA